MYDQLTDSGRERWAVLLDEADAARRARRVAARPRVAVREQVAATLIALARRIGPTMPAQPAPSGQLMGTP